MKYCYIALLGLLCLPVMAQTPFVTNPLNSAKIGDWAQYDFSLRSPVSKKLGTLKITLTGRKGATYTVDELLGHGYVGKVSTITTYPMSRNFVDQVKAIYGKTFKKFKIRKPGVRVKKGVVVNIGGTKHRCTEVRIAFLAENQKLPCKGDLVYYLKDRIGPLGLVRFHSTISYQTEKGQGFSLTQEVTLILTDWKKP